MQIQTPASARRTRIGTLVVSATLALSLLGISASPAGATAMNVLADAWTVDYQLSEQLYGNGSCKDKDGYPKPPKDKDGYPKPPKDKDKCPTPTPSPFPTVPPYPSP